MLGVFSTLAVSADAGSLVKPMTILFLCVLGGIGTVLLLPGPKQSTRFGGALLTLAGLALALFLFEAEAGHADSDTGPYFWIFAAIAIVGAVRVITHPRPVYSALYFVLTVFASAGLFILMYAEFMAAALVLIYAGAILITYVFVIMLAASAQTAGRSLAAGRAGGVRPASAASPFTAACIGFALMGVLLFVIFDKAEQQTSPLPSPPAVGRPVGRGAGSWLDAIHRAISLSESNGQPRTGRADSDRQHGRGDRDRPAASGRLDERFEPSTETISADATPVNDDPHSIPVYGTTNPRQKAFPRDLSMDADSWPFNIIWPSARSCS